MAFKVRYRPPADGTEVCLESVNEIVVGRDPGPDGLALLPFDETISAQALRISQYPDGIRIENTSSFAGVEVLLEQGSRWLPPGDATTTPSPSTAVLVGDIYRHEVVLIPLETAPARVPTGTRPSLVTSYQVPEERFPALVALCAARFYPDRFGTDLLTAPEIAKRISRQADAPEVSSKAVNLKLQRLREDIERRFGVPLETREDLAEWAVRNGLVNRHDVDAHMGL